MGVTAGRSASNGNGLGASGAGPARLLIDGSRLDGHDSHWWWLL